MSNETNPPAAKKAATKQAATKEAPKTVIRYCGKQPIAEGGERYERGDKMEITEKRAKALGNLVTKNAPE